MFHTTSPAGKLPRSSVGGRNRTVLLQKPAPHSGCIGSNRVKINQSGTERMTQKGKELDTVKELGVPRRIRDEELTCGKRVRLVLGGPSR